MNPKIDRLKEQNEFLENELRLIENYKFWFTNWVYHVSTGEFNVRQLDYEYDIKSKFEKRCRSIAIKSMIKDTIIEPANKNHGQYRLINSNLKQMNFLEASGEPFPLWLPFNIHQQVKIFPGNIIQINGQKNSGKTALMLATVRGNMQQHRVIYFNSEMGEQELRTRLELDNSLSLSSWNFAAFERSSDFHEVVRPGVGNINIIDFLECHDEFYKMGELMRKIHDALDGAIAIICVQMNIGSGGFALGGARTEEKPRLILNVTPNKIKIICPLYLPISESVLCSSPYSE